MSALGGVSPAGTSTSRRVGIITLSVVGGFGLLLALLGFIVGPYAFLVLLGMTLLLLGAVGVVVGREWWALIRSRRLAAMLLAAGVLFTGVGTALSPPLPETVTAATTTVPSTTTASTTTATPPTSGAGQVPVGGGDASDMTAAAAPMDYCAYHDPNPYTPNGTCRVGGEIVTVARIIDGDTFEVTDGRRVRLLGVDAPAAETCAGPGATGLTRGRIEGQRVKLLSEPGVDRDQYDRLLRYVQTSESVDRSRNLPVYAEDLGQNLVLEGWALPYEGGDANADYMDQIRSAVEIAAYRPEGMYAAPCGEPKVYGDDDGNGVADWDEDGNDGADAPNGNLPDGALTGGFCARKWYC